MQIVDGANIENLYEAAQLRDDITAVPGPRVRAVRSALPTAAAVPLRFTLIDPTLRLANNVRTQQLLPDEATERSRATVRRKSTINCSLMSFPRGRSSTSVSGPGFGAQSDFKFAVALLCRGSEVLQQ